MRCVSCSGTDTYDTGSATQRTVFRSVMPRFFRASTTRASFLMASSEPKISLVRKGAWTPFISCHESSLRAARSTRASKVFPACSITTSASRGTGEPSFQARTRSLAGSRNSTLAKKLSGAAWPACWSTSYAVQYSAVVKASSGWSGAAAPARVIEREKASKVRVSFGRMVVSRG